FASVNYNGNAIAGYQLSDTGFTQIVGYPLSDGLQVGDVAFTAAHDLYFTFAEDRNKVLNIKDLYQSSYDSTTYNLLLVKISADKKVTIAKWQSSTRQTLFGDLEANDSTVVFCTELSGKLSNGNQQLDASNLTKSEHAFYAFATYNTQLELQHLTPFQIEGKHIHPEVIEIENSHSFIVSGYAIQNIGPCNSVGVNNIREMWFASQLQYIIDTSRGDTTLIPNAFTPNADGLNDEWKIISSEFDSFTVLIFSKSGCIVYAQNAQHISWSGYRKGELLPTDHYFYLVNAFGSSGNRKFTGLVHLIR
ncbi:T9SS type B sorting domain-containing protein, partial [bacterium]|nr:T9SS type B sorting domain-containing protein [bacterium]